VVERQETGISQPMRFVPGIASFPAPMTGIKSFTIYWTNSNSFSCGSFNFGWSRTAALLRNSVPLTISPQNTGGFEYLVAPYNTAGTSFNIRADIFSYQGIQPPGLFVSRNTLPVLERFDFKNESIGEGGNRWFAEITLTNPAEGWYGIGVFLYGTSTSVIVTSNWAYNLPAIRNGDAYNNTIRGNAYYMVSDIPRLAQFLAQVSRAAPGGVPMVYFSSTGLASPLSYDFLLDTTQTTYVSHSVTNPPPLYTISVTCANQIDTFGFLTKITW